MYPCTYCLVPLSATAGGYALAQDPSDTERRGSATWCCWGCYWLLDLHWVVPPSDPEDN